MNKRVFIIGEMILATGTEISVPKPVLVSTYLIQVPHALN